SADARTTALRAVQQDLVIDTAIFVPLAESTFQIASQATVHGLGFEPSSGLPDGNYGVWIG
ncbi:MAG: hypothetical protein KIT69_18695, partial [Propionibacteriaceae bacterium]|nr:hypothetical protein [Propionibacteriaceae bacterium]